VSNFLFSTLDAGGNLPPAVGIAREDCLLPGALDAAAKAGLRTVPLVIAPMHPLLLSRCRNLK
jgi:hypothetical protein